MDEFIRALFWGIISYLVISLKYFCRPVRPSKFFLPVLIISFCIITLRACVWGGDALLRAAGFSSGLIIAGLIHYWLHKGKTPPDTTIVQCPRCLEVQVKCNTCIKCGLDFKKYNVSESLNLGDTPSVNQDDEYERMDPRVEKIMNASALMYVAIAAFVSLFDIGNLDISKFFCEVAKSMIPSLSATLLVSSDPNNTCLILALSWIWPLVTVCLIIKRQMEQSMNNSMTTILPQGKLFLKLLISLLMMAVVAAFFYAPLFSTKSGTGGIICLLMKNWSFGSALWGVMIYYTVVVTSIIAMSFLSEMIENFKNE